MRIRHITIILFTSNILIFKLVFANRERTGIIIKRTRIPTLCYSCIIGTLERGWQLLLQVYTYMHNVNATYCHSWWKSDCILYLCYVHTMYIIWYYSASFGRICRYLYILAQCKGVTIYNIYIYYKPAAFRCHYQFWSSIIILLCIGTHGQTAAVVELATTAAPISMSELRARHVIDDRHT